MVKKIKKLQQKIEVLFKLFDDYDHRYKIGIELAENKNNLKTIEIPNF